MLNLQHIQTFISTITEAMLIFFVFLCISVAVKCVTPITAQCYWVDKRTVSGTVWERDVWNSFSPENKSG